MATRSNSLVYTSLSVRLYAVTRPHRAVFMLTLAKQTESWHEHIREWYQSFLLTQKMSKIRTIFVRDQRAALSTLVIVKEPPDKLNENVCVAACFTHATKCFLL